MTELEQINEKLDKILALLQPKKELNASNSLDEVRGNINDGMPNPIDFRINANDFFTWIYITDRLVFTTEKRILKHSKNGKIISDKSFVDTSKMIIFTK